jgi:hypothetical protein
MDVVKAQINALFAKKEPWQIAAITTSSTLFVVWLYQFVTKEESKILSHNKSRSKFITKVQYPFFQGLVSRFKKKFFKYIRYVPAVRRKIEAEFDNIQKTFEDEMLKHGEELGYIVKLPEGN